MPKPRQMPEGRPDILVVHTGGLGDFLLTCPALMRLAESARLHLAGRRNRLALAVTAGFASDAVDFEELGFESAFHDLNDRLRESLEGIDEALLWMRHVEAPIENLQRCGVKRVRAYPGLPPPKWSKHASRYYLEQLGFTSAPPLRLLIPPAGEPWDVVIHPGSGSPTKNWPFDRFTRLAESLEARGRTVAWCLGPAEEGFRLPPEARVVRKESLVDLARTLAACSLYIGNDSGITHLAAAVGCPTVAVFGPTDPSVWAPRGEHVRVVRGDPWPETAQVLARAGAAPSQM